jgi:CheY-like chemotaxis protein
MPVRVLVAEEDLALQQIVHDILEMSFHDVRIERAMDADALLRKLRESVAYDLILYDLHFDLQTGNDALPMIRSEFPELSPKLVLVAASGDDVRGNPHAEGLTYVRHPFSLDDFTEVVKAVGGRGSTGPTAL